MESLTAAIADIRKKLNEGAFSSEDQVSKAVVMRLLQALRWDVWDPAHVSSEFKIGKRRVDYALLHEPFGAVVLIEVKDVGKATAKGEDQLFDYCSKQGVPLAVLTDGRTWSFYFPSGAGTYEQRRFATTDLRDDSPSGCAVLLERYLGYQAVVSRDSADARADYEAHRRQIIAREQFQSVFDALVVNADPRFVSLFAGEVEKRCHIRPGDTEVCEFLGAKPQPAPVSDPVPLPVPDPVPVPVPHPVVVPSFTLLGRSVTCKSDREVLVDVLTELGKLDASLYERLTPRLKGRSRNYLTTNRDTVYPRDASRAVWGHLAELPGGWWLGTQSSTRLKDRQLAMAREEARLSSSQLHWQFRGKT